MQQTAMLLYFPASPLLAAAEAVALIRQGQQVVLEAVAVVIPLLLVVQVQVDKEIMVARVVTLLATAEVVVVEQVLLDN